MLRCVLALALLAGCADVPELAQSLVPPAPVDDVPTPDPHEELPVASESVDAAQVQLPDTAGADASVPAEPSPVADAAIQLQEPEPLTYNFVWDGNSLMAGAFADRSMPTRVMAQAPLAGRGFTMSNTAVAGHSWQDMIDTHGAKVDAAWREYAVNVLVLWETTNYMALGYQPRETLDIAARYIAERQAVHRWAHVVLLSTLPRFAHGDGVMRAWNDLAAEHASEIGVDLFIDVRQPGSPFDFSGQTDIGFVATQQLWAETAEWLHLNGAGYQVVADMVSDQLARSGWID